MGNLSNILVMLFCVGCVFAIASVSIHDLNPANNGIYNCNDTIMSKYGTCTNNDLNGATPNTDASIVTTNLPTIDTGSANVVTVVVQTVSNVFASIGNWFSNVLGLAYLQTAMDTPRLILNIMGIPAFYVWAIGGLLTAIAVFYFIDWMKGAFA